MKRTARLVVLLAVVALAAFVLVRTMGAQQASMPFERTMWADEETLRKQPNLRRSMVNDLMNTHLTKGMSRQDVIALIGHPTDTSHFQDRDLVYRLGDEGGYISVDSAWLVIDLDAAGKVTGFETVTD